MLNIPEASGEHTPEPVRCHCTCERHLTARQHVLPNAEKREPCAWSLGTQSVQPLWKAVWSFLKF